MKLKLLILIITIITMNSCSINKYSGRQRANHIKQQEIQYEHSIPACKDPMRSTRNWWNRPQGGIIVFLFNLD